MGYESRIYVTQRQEVIAPTGRSFVFSIELAQFDLSVMSPGFNALFDTPIDYDLYFSNGDDERAVRTDRYDDHCCSTNITRVLEWAEANPTVREYRRAVPFLAYIEALDESAFDGEIQLVHYGH